MRGNERSRLRDNEKQQGPSAKTTTVCSHAWQEGRGKRPELLSEVLCLNEKCVCECMSVCVCVCVCSNNAQNAYVGSGRAGCLLQQQQLNEQQRAVAQEAGVWSRPLCSMSEHPAAREAKPFLEKTLLKPKVIFLSLTLKM